MSKASALAAVVTLLVVVLTLMVLSAVAASKAAAASTLQKTDRAITSARSGAEILLYVFQQLHDSGRLSAEHTPAQLAEAIKTELHGLDMRGIEFAVDGPDISVSSVILNSATGQSFSAKIADEDNGQVTVDVTGRAGDMPVVMRLKYNFRTGAHLILDPTTTS